MWKIDKSWTLFLDRDGTINKKLDGTYVKHWEEFEFLEGVLEAIPILNSQFQWTIIATNQQGIGKEYMTIEELQSVHDQMLEEINSWGGIIDEIYFCPELGIYDPLCRKPNPGMALAAKEHFPEINFERSVMVGDSITDMLFGKRLGMKTVFIDDQPPKIEDKPEIIDFRVSNLLDLAKKLLISSFN